MNVFYMHRDHLGSTTAITNEAGVVAERMSYEPFGKRRVPNGALDPESVINGTITDRGYTNHEHMDEVGLINMNGRIYDPDMSRFISADPGIPYSQNMQSYNRYSYTRGNPLRFIDPSGFIDGAPPPRVNVCGSLEEAFRERDNFRDFQRQMTDLGDYLADKIGMVKDESDYNLVRQRYRPAQK